MKNNVSGQNKKHKKMNFLYHIVHHIFIIIEGFTILIIDKIKNHQSLKTIQRTSICSTCKYKTSNGFCHLCGCYIKAKVRAHYTLDKNNKSIGGCPLHKW